MVGVRELNSTHAFFLRQLKIGKVYISGIRRRAFYIILQFKGTSQNICVVECLLYSMQIAGFQEVLLP
jgi:hypothetical protein